MQKRKETDMSTQQPDSLMGIMLEYFRHASQLPISTLCSEAGISTKTYLKLKKKDYPPLVRICKLFCVLYMHFPPEELGEMAKEATELWAEGIREKEKRK